MITSPNDMYYAIIYCCYMLLFSLQWKQNLSAQTNWTEFYFQENVHIN